MPARRPTTPLREGPNVLLVSLTMWHEEQARKIRAPRTVSAATLLLAIETIMIADAVILNIFLSLGVYLDKFEEEPPFVSANAHHSNQRVIAHTPEMVDDRLLVVDHCSACDLLQCPDLQCRRRVFRAKRLVKKRKQASGEGSSPEWRKLDCEPDRNSARIDRHEPSWMPLEEQGVGLHIRMEVFAEPLKVLKDAIKWMSRGHAGASPKADYLNRIDRLQRVEPGNHVFLSIRVHVFRLFHGHVRTQLAFSDEDFEGQINLSVWNFQSRCWLNLLEAPRKREPAYDRHSQTIPFRLTLLLGLAVGLLVTGSQVAWSKTDNNEQANRSARRSISRLAITSSRQRTEPRRARRSGARAY